LSKRKTDAQDHQDNLLRLPDFRNDNRAACLLRRVAGGGPLGIGDPQPAITLMLPDED
jgi:hypothetical protein